MHPTLSRTIKQITGIHHQSYVRPLPDLVHLGSHLHGYHIPQRLLKLGSVCYCIGAGDDISFDIELKTTYGCNVYIFDPTPYGIDHFSKLKECVRENRRLSLNNSPENIYTYKVDVDSLSEIKYVPLGVWDRKTTLTFHDACQQSYPSYSVCFFKDSKETIQAPVDRLVNIMKQMNHKAIDLVKLEIEGAEYKVIETIIQDRLDIKAILVEFDEVYNSEGRGFYLRIRRCTRNIISAGYVLIHSTDRFKRTFVRKDVYDELRDPLIARTQNG